MLIGNILTISWPTILQIFYLYSAIGLFHFIFRKKMMALSRNGGVQGEGFLWDFLFYATFGAVVTSSVSVAGVLLVFSYLVITSSIALLWVDGFPQQLCTAWLVGLFAHTCGVILSFVFDLPTGGTVIGVLGALFLAAFVTRGLQKSESA
jgi:zinc/manganese transport system permease protein